MKLREMWCSLALWHNLKFVDNLSDHTILCKCDTCGTLWAYNRLIHRRVPYRCVKDSYPEPGTRDCK